jgi:sugar phosphate isomerase/epimerase
MIKLSCATLSFDGFGDEDFVKTFLDCNKAGYEHLEFNLWYPATLMPPKIADLKERCKEINVSPGSIHVSSFGGEGSVGITKDLCHKVRAVDAALELGCHMISATGSGRGTLGGREEIIAVLKELAPYAQSKGVKISLENHQGNNLETIEDYQIILDAIPHDNVGVCMDTGHFDASGVSMDELIASLGDRINHIHLKENRGFGEKAFVRFGEGTTENSRIVEKMLDREYSGYLVIEVSPEISKVDGKPFTLEDLIKPYKMFSPYEKP